MSTKTLIPRSAERPRSRAANSDPRPPEIRVEDLHKSFGEHQVLRGVDLLVRRGELVAIVGTSSDPTSKSCQNFTDGHSPEMDGLLDE